MCRLDVRAEPSVPIQSWNTYLAHPTRQRHLGARAGRSSPGSLDRELLEEALVEVPEAASSPTGSRGSASPGTPGREATSVGVAVPSRPGTAFADVGANSSRGLCWPTPVATSPASMSTSSCSTSWRSRRWVLAPLRLLARREAVEEAVEEGDRRLRL